MSRTEMLSAPKPFPWKLFVKVLLVSALGLFFVRTFVVDLGYRVALSKSESLDTAIFLVSPFDERPQSGELVYFRAPQNPYFDGPVIKRVVGVPGDTIEVRDRQVYVNGRDVGRAKSLTRTGEPLNPIQLQTIPDNHVFVAGEHIDSYDSRYAEFGLVPNYLLFGKAKAVF